MARKRCKVDTEIEGRIDLVSPVRRVWIDVGRAILLESDKRDERRGSYDILAARGLVVFEKCLEGDGDEVDVVVGYIYETGREELKAAHVDVVRVDVSVLCRVGRSEAVSRCVLSHVVVPVDDLAETL